MFSELDDSEIHKLIDDLKRRQKMAKLLTSIEKHRKNIDYVNLGSFIQQNKEARNAKLFKVYQS